MCWNGTSRGKKKRIGRGKADVEIEVILGFLSGRDVMGKQSREMQLNALS